MIYIDDTKTAGVAFVMAYKSKGFISGKDRDHLSLLHNVENWLNSTHNPLLTFVKMENQVRGLDPNSSAPQLQSASFVREKLRKLKFFFSVANVFTVVSFSWRSTVLMGSRVYIFKAGRTWSVWPLN